VYENEGSHRFAHELEVGGVHLSRAVATAHSDLHAAAGRAADGAPDWEAVLAGFTAAVDYGSAVPQERLLAYEVGGGGHRIRRAPRLSKPLARRLRARPKP
jgi:hypothetical protein